MIGDLTRPWVSLLDRKSNASLQAQLANSKTATSKNSSSAPCMVLFVERVRLRCVLYVRVCNCGRRGQWSSHRNVQRERFHSRVQKIMKGQSGRARHSEGWEGSEERAATIFIFAGSHIKYE